MRWQLGDHARGPPRVDLCRGVAVCRGVSLRRHRRDSVRSRGAAQDGTARRVQRGTRRLSGIRPDPCEAGARAADPARIARYPVGIRAGSRWLRLNARGKPPAVDADQPWIDIAAEIGLTHEAVYRALARLQRSGATVARWAEWFCSRPVRSADRRSGPVLAEEVGPVLFVQQEVEERAPRQRRGNMETLQACAVVAFEEARLAPRLDALGNHRDVEFATDR